MNKSEIDLLAEYYRLELSYLRSAGKDFSSRFPKIAKRLDLSHDESSDPHVERLIESFAFLTGKLQKQIDDQYPEAANAMIDVIYKPLILPIPSATMINFDVDLSKFKKKFGLVIPRHTSLQATSNNDIVCTFTTAHNVKLWPIILTDTELITKESIISEYLTYSQYLKLDFECESPGICPKKLRCYIICDALLRGKIFAGIFSASMPAILLQENHSDLLPKVSPIGLTDEEALFEYPKNVHKGFRYLQEYFAFPDKFYGFDINIDKELSNKFSICIPLKSETKFNLSKNMFSFFAVPAVNLFQKVSEPLHLDYKQIEYRLVPDFRRYESHEIYMIKKMVAVNPVTNDELEIPEFYSCNHFTSESDIGISWIARRKESLQKNSLGDDAFVSFVDEKFNPKQPADKIFYAYTLCTNRHIAEDIPAHGIFQTDISSLPVKQIYCINRPTPQKNSLKNGEILWKLISAISLNSLSFSDDGILKLKEILRLFANITDSQLKYEVDAILNITSRIGMKRITNQTWYGFINGTDITIEFDESLYNKGIPLSLIISKFLSTYTSINTFVDVNVKNKEGKLCSWETQLGKKKYL